MTNLDVVHTKQKKNLLITGGTGFLGKAVLARLVESELYDKLYLLVRPNRRDSAEVRVEKIVERIFPPAKRSQLASRVIAVPGDLTAADLGISEEMQTTLRKNVHQILHVGASTDFGAPLDESRLNNVEGSRHVLDLALDLQKNGVFERFEYVSTAYTAGVKAGYVTEKDLDRGQKFANNYEQSKFEAEQLVKTYQQVLPITIYRPSIVVGDSKNGFTPHFKVLYWPLLLLAKEILPFFSCNEKARLDVVPVDFVADGIVALMQLEDTLGETYYLSAGIGNELRIRNFLRDSYQIADIKKVPIVPFWFFNLIKNTFLKKRFSDSFWDAVELASPYESYLRGTDVRFDSKRSTEKLKELGIECPRWEDYKREVLTFCKASRWGKKVPMPEYIYYLPVSNRKDHSNEFEIKHSKPRISPAPV